MGSANRTEALLIGAKTLKRQEVSLDPDKLRGRLIELSGGLGSGVTSLAVSMLLLHQEQRETLAWIQPQGAGLYPPDLAEAGVDLSALVVVHVPPGEGKHGVTKAAELLLRSGAFGFVVLDLRNGAPRDAAWQGRLGALLRKHGSTLLVLTDLQPTRGEAHQPSLGTMVSLRISPERERCSPGRFLLRTHILKDKAAAFAAPNPIPHRGPWGLG